MNPAYRYTLAETLAIIVGALLINLYLAHRDHTHAELCAANPTHEECKQ